jgi:HEAT repeat protein
MRSAGFGGLRQLFRLQPWLATAFSLLLIAGGVGLGYAIRRPAPVPDQASAATAATAAQPVSDRQQLAALSTQVHEMREMMMLSLLQNPSASERMRGVSYTSEIKNVNPGMADALLATLNNDPNVNVRLTTLEALTHFANDPAVREGLVQSILQQDSPLVQSALADVMLKLQEKRSIRSFKKLLQQKDLNGMVRTKIQQTINRLT